MDIRRIARDGVLSAVALTIFIVELQLPELVPLPGVKLGLANIVTVAAMFMFGPSDAALILTVRIILGSVFGGNMMALIYSAAGGALSFALLLCLKKLLTPRQIWVGSVLTAAAHNLGQLLAAWAVTRTAAVFTYLPVMTVAGMAAGALTGLCAQLVVDRLRKK